MFYRFLIKKDNKTSGLFHPHQKWCVQKENGLYDVVRKNFSNLNHIKSYTGKTISWFTEKGIEKFKDGIYELKEFYKNYQIDIIRIEKDKLFDIVEEDEFQVWCKKK